MKELTATNTIQVVLASDANYVMPLAVTICSAAVNCDRNRRLVFNVFQQGIGPDLRQKVEVSLERTGFPGARITWLDAPLERIADFKLGLAYTTPLTFVRILIPELIDDEVDKVLYLDSDVVACEDIGKLWDFDVSDKSLLAARDIIAFVSRPKGIVNYCDLGIPGDTPYFNAGVLLMNLKRWRDRHVTEKISGYLRTYHDVIQLADQEALNAILWNDWGELDFHWNWQIVHRSIRLGKREMVWTPEGDGKSIIHFTTAEKPWLPGCDYDERKYFFEYLDRTEWGGWRVPWLDEVYARSLRTVADARDALGSLRHSLKSKTDSILK